MDKFKADELVDSQVDEVELSLMSPTKDYLKRNLQKEEKDNNNKEDSQNFILLHSLNLIESQTRANEICKIRCTFKYFGETLIDQKNFICPVCDPNKEKPICSICIETCHKECVSLIKSNYYDKDGTTICYCGLHNHTVKEKKVKVEEKNMNCNLIKIQDKCEKLYRIYKTKDNKLICEYCEWTCYGNKYLDEGNIKIFYVFSKEFSTGLHFSLSV